MPMTETLLRIENLSVHFGAGAGLARAVEGVDLELARGETAVLLGESGSGKTLTALSVVRLLPAAARIDSGRVLFAGEDLLALPERLMPTVRGRRIGYVFQEPQSALNPVMSIGDQIGEVFTTHLGLRGRARTARVQEALAAVGIPEPAQRMREYPHQFSGGMKQRAMLAIALAAEPDLLIADEPTTALDVTLQAQVLALLQAEQRRRGMAMLFITHDLGVAAQVADRIVVMQAGRIVETTGRADFANSRAHPYTRRLFDAMPKLVPRHRPALPEAAPTLLEVRDLRVVFPVRRGLLRRVVDEVRAVDGVSWSLRAGETLAVVGESGSGKTTMGRGVLQLLPLAGGEVRHRGVDLRTLDAEAMRRRRRQLQVVFQDPYAAMNPRMLVADILAEGMVAQGLRTGPGERAARVAELLGLVGLEAAHARRYPHEFSGGQRQRLCIARALAVEPEVLVCDEPTSALDVSVQSQILELLETLQRELGLAYLFITHNLGVVARIAHRVAVMQRGVIVEQGPVDQVLFAPRHPYTQALVAAVPRMPTVGS